jgi:hypothetical protein
MKLVFSVKITTIKYNCKPSLQQAVNSPIFSGQSTDGCWWGCKLRLLVHISARGWVHIRRVDRLGKLEYPMRSSEIELATFRHVAQSLSQLSYRVPQWGLQICFFFSLWEYGTHFLLPSSWRQQVGIYIDLVHEVSSSYYQRFKQTIHRGSSSQK